MSKSRPPYPAGFRRKLIALVRAGRSPDELAKQFEPTAQTIRNWLAQAECCPNKSSRKTERNPFEAARDVARKIAKTDPYKQSRKKRKKIDLLFAHLKRFLKLDRLRLPGPNGAQK